MKEAAAPLLLQRIGCRDSAGCYGFSAMLGLDDFKAALSRRATVEVGDRAPSLEVTLPGGERVGLDRYSGQSVLLVFMRHLG